MAARICIGHISDIGDADAFRKLGGIGPMIESIFVAALCSLPSLALMAGAMLIARLNGGRL